MKRLAEKFSKSEEPSAPASAARVTDESLERHRKEVFSRGRRFVYPIHITKHHIVRNSLIIIGIIAIAFLAGCGLAIYRYKSDSLLVYRISQIVPFPAAKVNDRYVNYEEYIFLLRSNKTYITTKAEGASEEELDLLRQESFLEAKKNAILKQLAERYDVRVSNEDIDNQVALLESFSGGQKRLDEIVSEFYGISASELRYLLYVQLLEQKIAPHISLEAKAKADSIQERLANGEDFAALARELSDDEQTAGNGGSLGTVKTGLSDLPDEVVKAGLALSAGKSEIVAGPNGFHVIKKVAEKEEGAADLAHIFIRYDDVDGLLEKELEDASIRDFIRI